jgi:hypothetical protein
MTPLEQLAASTLDRPAPAAVTAMAEHLRRERKGIAAILAYGSCLRGASAADTLIDLYLLVDQEGDISANLLARFGARFVPPNVYYAQHAWDGEILRCKYAVMTLDAFASRMRRDVSNPYFWARFSQPASLVYGATDEARGIAIAAVATAIETMFAASLAAAPPQSDSLAVWQRGFAETYRTELRPEGSARSGEIIAANAQFYRDAARLLDKTAPLPLSWPRVRMIGKLLSLLRLAKAAFTFEGGADYAAFKIERHTGKKIPVTEWQRRHPFLAGLLMLPALLRSRALH